MRRKVMKDASRKLLWFHALAALYFCASSLKVVVAQSVIPLSVDDALNVRKFAEWMPISPSPDGQWLSYTIQDSRRSKAMDFEAYMRTGVPAWISRSDIFLTNMRTGETRRLTDGRSENWLPAWSPDGRYLAFLSDRDASGKARLWVWDATKNEMSRVVEAPVASAQIEWTPDSRRLLVTTIPENRIPEQALTSPSSQRESGQADTDRTLGPTVTLYKSEISGHDESALVKSDPWNLDLNLRDLIAVDIKEGRIATVAKNIRIGTLMISPDGSYVAYTIPKRFERPGSQQILFDLGIVDLSNLSGHIIASAVRLDYDGAAFSWSPDGLLLSFHTGGMDENTFDCYVLKVREGELQNVTNFSVSTAPRRLSSRPLWDTSGHIYLLHAGDLWRASVSGHKAQQLSHVSNREIIRNIPWSTNLLWTPDGGKSTVVMTHDDSGKQDGFYRVELGSGENSKLLERNQCYTCATLKEPFVVSKTGQELVYFAEDAQRDEDLSISDASFQNPRLLTHLNPQFDKYEMGAVKLIQWLSDDGTRLHGALLLPSDYVEGKRYPLIVWVYGGSFLSNCLDHFGLAGTGPFNMQLLATRGYAVLLPDAPQQVGTPMLDLAKTVLPGVSKVVEMGIADEDRIGLLGQSYGAYSVLSLIVQTPRFKTAVEIDGYSDILGAYGAMDKDGTAFGTSVEEEGQGLMMGTPWQVRPRYIENSPIFFLDRVVTPVLIIHGARDKAVPSFLGDQVFVALRRLGKEVEYARYEGESHSMYEWAYVNQVDLWNRLIDWLGQQLTK
jgi:dipeptidyl aminopeptidase/acylaminoacyl peptidase